MDERKSAVTFKGNPLTLLGPERRVGDKMPDFTVVDTALKPVRESETRGTVRIFASVPSLDTPVCDLEARRFNEEAAKLDGVRVLVVSMDLPFAQKRWCGAAGANQIVALSDYQSGSFGLAMGTLIKEMHLESRAIFIAGKDDVIRYVEYVPEIGQHPNYEQALHAARQALK